MAGINFFCTGPKTSIRVTNLNDCKINKKIFTSLLGVTITEVTPVSQFLFENVGETQIPSGLPINGKKFYEFTAQQAIDSLKKYGKNVGVWGEVPPQTKVYLDTSACVKV